MYLRAGTLVEFAAHFQDSDGVSKTGLSVTCDIYGPDHTALATGQSTTEIASSGIYYKQYQTTISGNYYVVFKTADTTVAARHLATEITAVDVGVWGIGGSCG